jgi:hypothetical protein
MKTMRTALTLVSAFGLGLTVFAQTPQRDPDTRPAPRRESGYRDSANGKGKFEARRGGGDVSKAFVELGPDGRATVEITTRNDRRTFRPRWERTTEGKARLYFDDRDLSGDGRVEFQDGRLIGLDLKGHGDDGDFNLNFRRNDDDRWGNDDRDNWRNPPRRPGWGDRDDDWKNHDRDDRRGWGGGSWSNHDAIVWQWSGTRDGRGTLEREDARDRRISQARVLIERDGDTVITLIGRDSDTFRGRAHREGDKLFIELRSAFGERVEGGSATVYLSRRYGEFYKVTLHGHTRGGRYFEATFDDWN